MSAVTGLIFPGQGSQSVGMGYELASMYPIAKDIFTSADDQLEFKLSKIAWEGPAEKLNDTVHTQPALFVHSIAALRVLEDLNQDTKIKLVAGHSMGELSALVASGALSFEDGLRLVQIRGRLMKKAGELSPGGMAAILGLDISELEKICDDASLGEEIVQVANDNCPGQVVISGTDPAIIRAIILAKERGAKRAIKLAVSIAAHSPLMNHVQEEFNQAVEKSPITDPHTPIIGNVNASPLKSAQEIKNDLLAQLTHRVRWTESINFMIKKDVNVFIEIGNGTVLSGLVKRINRDATTISLRNPEDFERFLTLPT